MNINDNNKNIITIGNTHFNHLSKDNPAIVTEPTVHPSSGEIKFVNPSPNWNACTASCGVAR